MTRKRGSIWSTREGRRAYWSLIGAGARTGWRLRRGKEDRGTTTGRFIRDAVKFVKKQAAGANPIRDIKRAAARPPVRKSTGKVAKPRSSSSTRRRRRSS